MWLFPLRDAVAALRPYNCRKRLQIPRRDLQVHGLKSRSISSCVLDSVANTARRTSISLGDKLHASRRSYQLQVCVMPVPVEAGWP